VSPFVDTGVSLEHLTGVESDSTTVVRDFEGFVAINHQTTAQPLELTNRSSRGFVAGGGFEFRVGFVRLLPEIRYTHWLARNFTPLVGTQFGSKVNEVNVLLGIAF
jgi:hypothetical protein